MDTDNNGWESGQRLEPVIDKLLQWQASLGGTLQVETEADAERIGLLNRIDTAIQLLRLCDEYHVIPGTHWDTVPNLISPCHQPEVRIVDDGESDRASAWRELALESGNAVRLHGGEVIIGGQRTSPYTREG